jgi:putative protease|tara:strand:+ start:727 stop:1932 length:1206 start_codon:yes stop_codon:yes gene_type:complete
MKLSKKKPELLSPVQDFVSLTAAIQAGADAIYFGIKGLNMRAGARNFLIKDLKKIIEQCHKNKVKAYLALNTIIYDKELKNVQSLLKKAKEAKVDAIIAWDFSIINEANKLNLPIHISTQASLANFEAIKTLKKQYKNIQRVILARELDLTQISSIISQLKKAKINIEIETFIHGAMCVSVSGRCFLSQEVFGKSANRGECLQPCRRLYTIKDVEEGHEFELGPDYVLSPKDLCTITIIDKLLTSGISCFKIEGRNRSPEYVKVVTEVYREAIDNKKADKKKLFKKLKTVYNRGFSKGFYLGKPIDEWSKDYGSQASKKKIYVGVVKNFYKKHSVAEIKVETHGIKIGDHLMIQGNKTGVIEQKVNSMQINHKEVKQIKKGKIGIKLEKSSRENDKVFVIK